jgi:hypothetical protein
MAIRFPLGHRASFRLALPLAAAAVWSLPAMAMPPGGDAAAEATAATAVAAPAEAPDVTELAREIEVLKARLTDAPEPGPDASELARSIQSLEARLADVERRIAVGARPSARGSGGLVFPRDDERH